LTKQNTFHDIGPTVQVSAHLV